MDLIYTDENMTDQDVITDYTLDLAYGYDENDFSLSIPLQSHCMEEGYYIYIEGTEYGGKVTKIKVDTKNNQIVYSGKTWHGIIENHVIEPDKGYDYFVVSGEANEVIAKVITHIGLDDIFAVPEDDSGIIIQEYKFYYTAGYTGLLEMLEQYNAKLVIWYEDGKVMICAADRADYSTDEEWDSSQITFTIEKNFRPINHLICLGQGSLKSRNIIHLFADEGGGVQPYAVTDNPVYDSDYILDKSRQLLFGTDEVTEVYDCDNAQETENYVRCGTQPSDWESNYNQYYTMEIGTDGNPDYKNVEGEKGYQYNVLSAQPANWATNYGDYFQKDGNDYKAVPGEKHEVYTLLKNKPSDWEKNYRSYYYHYFNGVEWSYEAAQGKNWTEYVRQTSKPSDWEKNFASYYQRQPKKNNKGEKVKNKQGKVVYEYVSVPSASKKRQKAPAWKKKPYYTAQNRESAPDWQANYYYAKTETPEAAPAWKTGTYYSKSETVIIPAFSGNVYKKVIDHYAKLVEEGIEKLKSSYEADSIDTELDLAAEYDIGDIVGANENTTGISTWQPIGKKIVKIERNRAKISYEVGKGGR